MTIDTLRHFFAWCAVINYSLLIFWFVLSLAAHGFFTRLADRFFGVDAETYDRINLSAMFYFKLAIWLFNITPYLVLRLAM